ncbi:MAG: AMP-binding protein [Thermoanaerobaculia bacterium]
MTAAAESLTGLFAASLSAHADRPAFTDDGGGTLTYADVAARVARLHALFHALHVRKGDKVALLGRNSSAWATVYVAALTYGAAVVPILPDFKREDVQHIVRHSDAVLLFVQGALASGLEYDRMPELSAALSLETFRVLFAVRDRAARAAEAALAAPAGAPEIEEIPLRETAAIVYTSGTTGFSKGVVLPHESLFVNIRFAKRHMPLVPGETIVSFLPLAHAFGCAFEFLFPFASGCHITFVNQLPAPAVLLAVFARVRPRLILSVPLVLEKIYRKKIRPLLDRPVPRLLLRVPILRRRLGARVKATLSKAFGGNFREIIVGGAALSPDVEAFLMEIGFPLTVGYGMTECGPLISYAPWTEHRAGTVGRIIDALEARIDSPDPRMIPGELLIRGPSLFCGYYRNPEATREAVDADGWLRTGDLGTLDAAGFLTLKGRCKTMLLSASGQNVFPEEIEARLNALPYVGESLVLDKAGRLVALVYPDLERVDSGRVSEADLVRKMEENRRTLNASLPPYAGVSRIDLWPEEFVKTPTRKIKRFLYSQPA